ncbi:MAG: ATP-binding cassette domain-containing protein [Candidatus Aminicenantes bacterium]|nr:ATP-binding cassette domain-containing protein [Candidatus Aminicenantes bacterium]
MMDICAEKLKQVAGDRAILDEISLEFAAGAVNVILGPNGAGKSTLLRLLCLLDRPAQGEIFYDGLALRAMRRGERTALRRRIGFVFQAPLLLAGSVEDNLLYGPRLRGMDVSGLAIRNVLQTTGLEGREAQEARQLSGGEKQRLQLARVMLLDPELYLLDEPTANLDPLSVKNIEIAITRLAHSGKTVILATHNLIQARLLAGRVIFLKAGKLVQAGSASDVLSCPLSLDIAEFSAAENIVAGTLVRRNGRTMLDCGKLAIEVVSEQEQGAAAAVIRPEDILVSQGPVSSSARNSFPGSIMAAVDLGLVVSLRVDCDGVMFTVFVTRHSCEQMGLRPGAEVLLTFKATSVHLLASG